MAGGVWPGRILALDSLTGGGDFSHTLRLPSWWWRLEMLPFSVQWPWWGTGCCSEHGHQFSHHTSVATQSSGLPLGRPYAPFSASGGSVTRSSFSQSLPISQTAPRERVSSTSPGQQSCALLSQWSMKRGVALGPIPAARGAWPHDIKFET